jgi:hypothetical protein
VIATFGKSLRREFAESVSAPQGEFFPSPIRGADENRGEIALGLGGIQIGEQADPIRHWDGDIALHGHRVARRRQLQQAGQE